MKASKAIKDFPGMGDTDLLAKGRFVASSMKGNSFFPDPEPTIKVLETALNRFDTALMASSNGDRVKIQKKRAMRIALIAVMTSLLGYVNFKADGNREMLLSSGFTVSTETSNTVVLGTVGSVKLANGANSGEVIASIGKVQGAASYVFCITETPVVATAWITHPNRTTKLVLDSLTRGKEYAVRIGALGGPDGKTTVYSAIVTIIAQ